MHFCKIHRSQKSKASTSFREKKAFSKKEPPGKKRGSILGSWTTRRAWSGVRRGLYDMRGYMVSESAIQPASAEVYIVPAAPRCRHTTVVVAMACALALAAITWYVCRRCFPQVMRHLLTCNATNFLVFRVYIRMQVWQS